MKRLFALCFLLCAGTMSACQCSDKPEIGPVEEEDEARLVVVHDPQVA